jgi:hypothetical protein
MLSRASGDRSGDEEIVRQEVADVERRRYEGCQVEPAVRRRFGQHEAIAHSRRPELAVHEERRSICARQDIAPVRISEVVGVAHLARELIEVRRRFGRAAPFEGGYRVLELQRLKSAKERVDLGAALDEKHRHEGDEGHEQGAQCCEQHAGRERPHVNPPP